MQDRELELDTSKIYRMPSNICMHQYKDKFLIISPETANWLLLHNEAQIEIFHFLSAGETVEQLFDFFSDSMEDIMHVLTELEAKEFENTELTYPQEQGIYIYLTNKCNQRCKHCYMNAGNEFSSELGTEEVKKILSSFAKLGGKVATFTGGEATLRSDFLELAEFAKHCKLETCLLSNGLLFESHFIDAMRGYVDEIQISIDGYDSKSYMQTRNTDSFFKVLGNVDELVDSGFKITVAISPVLTSLIENEKEYYEFACYLTNKYKNKNFTVKFATELFDGRDVNLTEDEKTLYNQVSTSIKNLSQHQSSEEEFALNHSYNKVLNNCGYGGITVSADGDVYFCNLISECAVQANIREQSFEAIMELSINARKISDVANLTPCSKCDLKYLCGGGCRVKFFPNVVRHKISHDILPIKNVARSIPCTQEYKDKIYNLMIASNELFYR